VKICDIIIAIAIGCFNHHEYSLGKNLINYIKQIILEEKSIQSCWWHR